MNVNITPNVYRFLKSRRFDKKKFWPEMFNYNAKAGIYGPPGPPLLKIWMPKIQHDYTPKCEFKIVLPPPCKRSSGVFILPVFQNQTPSLEALWLLKYPIRFNKRFNKIAISNNKFQMASGQGSHWLIESPTIFSSMCSPPLSDICQFYF